MKTYIQPITQLAVVEERPLCVQSFTINGSGEDPTKAEAPLRNFSGDLQSLKYLI